MTTVQKEAENSTVESIGDVPVLAVEDAGRREMNGDNNSTSSLIHKEICPPSTRKGIQNASVKNSSTNNDASSFVDSVNQIVALFCLPHQFFSIEISKNVLSWLDEEKSSKT